MGLDAGSIGGETNLLEDLNADSLDSVEIVMSIEDEFDINIADEEWEQVQTIGQVVALVKQQLEEID